MIIAEQIFFAFCLFFKGFGAFFGCFSGSTNLTVGPEVLVTLSCLHFDSGMSNDLTVAPHGFFPFLRMTLTAWGSQ